MRSFLFCMQIKRLGIDAGSLYVKIVILDGDETSFSSMSAHNGNPAGAIGRLMRENGIAGTFLAGITGQRGAEIAAALKTELVDEVKAHRRAVSSFYPGARTIISIGAASAALMELDENGELRHYSANSMCAAGTGSFLDQQLSRLGLRYEDTSHFDTIANPPPVAARCAVFAKSDLVHRQQEGYSKAAMWSGLCRGLAHALMNTLLRGRRPEGLTVVVGGVAANATLMKWLSAACGGNVVSFALAPYSAAIGAARLAVTQIGMAENIVFSVAGNAGEPCAPLRKPLVINKSILPPPSPELLRVDRHGNEISISAPPAAKQNKTWLGIDVGSTSVKAVICDNSGKIILDAYRKTGGEPVRAAQALLAGIEEALQNAGVEAQVLGCATTGSGRKIIGAITGADLVINEITAHARGALYADKSIETIFEIGGQDSKYMRISGGVISDAVMNYACAAGTGSFLEEQAKNLGFTLNEASDSVIGVAPGVLSDRCTVFMEQDINGLLRRGYSRRQAMAAATYSVAQNYLNKVVAGRFVSGDKVFFQGATARNKGLVAAFENLLGVSIVVSAHCHVAGAHGAALLVKELCEKEGRTSSFRGFAVARRRILLEKKPCAACHNRCAITYAHIEGEARPPSFGYRCGKDGDSQPKKTNVNFAPFAARAALFRSACAAGKTGAGLTVGLPRALGNYQYLPLWSHFLDGLGCRLKITGTSDEEIAHTAARVSAADFCFPVKVAAAHVQKLAEDGEVDYIFLPQMISGRRHRYATNNYFCPYVQSAGAQAAASAALSGKARAKLIMPAIDFNLGKGRMSGELYAACGAPLHVTRRQVAAAFTRARKAYEKFCAGARAQGKKLLDELARSGKPAVVILGRPYNTADGRVALDLPRKIAQLGVTVIPLELVAFNPRNLGRQFENMFWIYGQMIIAAAKMVRGSRNLYAVYLTNYGCGPDSFLVSFVREIMKGKPFLALELDEHSGDAGYMTRIEAYLDVIRHDKGSPAPQPQSGKISRSLANKTLWIPPMQPAGAHLVAAAFRRFGYDARPLPDENEQTCALGRSLAAGNECLPMALTIGSFVSMLRGCSRRAKDQVLFMPTSDGPCRFGQYALMHRLILDRLGYTETGVLSPSSQNTYAGLSMALRNCMWRAVVVSDILFKARCRLKPYELQAGATEYTYRKAVERMVHGFERGEAVTAAFSEAIGWFSNIGHSPLNTKPLVGVVGEIFVRSNPYSNERLVDEIEKRGAEAWVSPVAEWVLYSAWMQKRESARRGPLKRWIAQLNAGLGNRYLHRDERMWYNLAGKIVAARREPEISAVIAAGGRYVPVDFSGETILTLGRAALFAGQGARLVVNVAPFGCMHGVITSAIFHKLQKDYSIPVVTMFYEGGESAGRRLGVYLDNAFVPQEKKEGVDYDRIIGQSV